MDLDRVKWRSIRKYPCKVNKGEHEYDFLTSSAFSLGGSDKVYVFLEYYCLDCKKKSYLTFTQRLDSI